MREEEILYEAGDYWVKKDAKGNLAIYRNGITHAIRVAYCGYPGQKGMDWCKAEIARRLVS